MDSSLRHCHVPSLLAVSARLRPRWALLCLVAAGLLAMPNAVSATGMKVGNLVFKDSNANGHYDAGEGVDGVQVEIWQATGDNENPYALTQTVSTSGGGLYLFAGLASGSYHVTIPATEFGSGAALAGLFSLPSAQLVGDDDTGEDGQDDPSPEINGISTLDFVVTSGFGPVGAEESGVNGISDDSDDANGDMTVDFGFYKPVAVGNLVFADMNGNGRADAGEGIPGVVVQLYSGGDIPGTIAPWNDAVTDSSGHFQFGGLLPGDYKLFVPAWQFLPGGQLQGALSMTGVGFDEDDDDANTGGHSADDGVDDPDPATNGIVSRTVTLTEGAAPTFATGETGSDAASDDAADADTDLTVDLGFVFPPGKVGVGNMVFIDADNNGHYDTDEGVAGVTVQLFAGGADPLVDSPVATCVTSSDGHYLFGNLDPGSYFLRVPPTDFQAGGALFSALSVTGVAAGDDQLGEDGIDDAYPEVHGIRTAAFSLAVGSTPVDANTELGEGADADNFRDDSVDLTRDLGFRIRAVQPLSVGNLVFKDTNGNGHADSGEGVASVTVQLFHEGEDPSSAVPLATQQTNATGGYLFSGILPGRYFVHVSAAMFATGQPLEGLMSMPGNGLDDHLDDNVDENGVDAASPGVTGINSIVVELTENQEPVETGYDASQDNVDDNNGDLTIDLGFAPAPTLGIGNLVFRDRNNNGHFDAGEGMASVTVQLFNGGDDPQIATPLLTTTTSSTGRYFFTGLAPASYKVHIPAVNFTAGQPLYRLLSLTGNGGDAVADDDVDENGIDSATPETTGISSTAITLAYGTEPGPVIETGADGTSDNANDSNVDLTVDFGFDMDCAVYAIVPGILTNAQLGTAYSVGFTAPGGEGVLSWSLESGALPPGITLTPEGLLSGTPTQAGAYGFAIAVIDTYDCLAEASFTLTVQDPALLVGVGNVVFKDANGNGHYDAGEGVDGVSVQLFPSDANPQASVPVASTVTASGGRYAFTGLNAGSYKVYVPAENFELGGPLDGLLSVTGVGTAPGWDDNLDEDGVDSPNPDVTGISSRAFSLSPGTAPTDSSTEQGVGATDDNAADANFDATIDLGFIDPAQVVLGVGNLVFIDANNNGHYDAGEGVAGVTVKLFNAGADPLTATPLDIAVTDANGAYLLTTNATGNYVVFIPPSEFGSGKPLHSYRSVAGNGTDNGVDDGADENGVDDASPAIHGIASTTIHLQAGTEPTAASNETGFQSDTDDENDSNYDLTIDFGFVLDCPTISIAPSALPPATNGFAYSQQLTATGGSGAVVFSVVAGSLPSGITLSSAGLLAGTSTSQGSFSITIRVTDENLCHTDTPMELVVNGKLGVGNLAFFDANGNGHADPGEGVDGVTVQLYHSTDTPGTSTPITTATTSGGGLYLIDDLPPGSYLLHVPSAMFATSAPLWKMKSVSGVMTSGDDDAGERGQDAVDPTITGVTTAVFTLAAGTAPTENGIDGDSDDAREADVDLTQDFGFIDLGGQPATFADWATSHSLAGGNADPAANPDGDARSNLMEYALGLNPGGGADNTAAVFAVTHNGTSGKMDLQVRRRHGGQGDLTYSLEVMPALSGAVWTESTVVPVIVNNGDGTETLTYGSLDDDPALVGSNYGFVRLRVSLDADHNGFIDATDTSEIMGWQRRTFAVKNQTYAVPFVPSPIFTATVDGVAGDALDITTAAAGTSFASLLTSGREYYVEVMGGDNQGHRWEIDEAASTANGIVLLPAHERSTQTLVPASLTTDLIAVRPHWRVVDLFPPASYHATGSSQTADELLIWNQTTGGYTVLWLANYFGQAHWHQVGVASLVLTEDNRVISPCDGLFTKPRVGSVSAFALGQIRTWSFACPLKPGVNFIGNPFAVSQSPYDRGMTIAGGFTGTGNAQTSDRIQFWNGDTSNTEGYLSYQLLNAAGHQLWKVVGTADLVTDYGSQKLFTAGAAAFIRSVNGKADWLIPAPAIP